MTPTELAQRHPLLYHVAHPDAWPAIARLGLLPAAELAPLFGVPAQARAGLLARRRACEIRLDHDEHGTAVLSDNIPLSDRALASCLDDGMKPADWYVVLNARVFFWASRDGAERLLRARINRNRPRALLAFDTLGLASAHAARVEISPINSGATLRKPARRGLTTFTPLLQESYGDWRRKRGGSDRILEVVVRGGVPDIARYLVSATVSP